MNSIVNLLSEINALKPTSGFGGVLTRRDALPRVPNLQMTRHPKNGARCSNDPMGRAIDAGSSSARPTGPRLQRDAAPEGRGRLDGDVSHRLGTSILGRNAICKLGTRGRASLRTKTPPDPLVGLRSTTSPNAFSP